MLLYWGSKNQVEQEKNISITIYLKTTVFKTYLDDNRNRAMQTSWGSISHNKDNTEKLGL